MATATARSYRADRKLERKPHEALWRHLSSFAALTDQELSIIRQTAAVATPLSAGAELYAEGEVLRKPVALVAGWACRLRVLTDGRRQIFDFLLPGDLVSHAAPFSPVASTSALTLTAVKIASIGCLREMAGDGTRFPGLAHAWAAAQARQDAFLLNHVVRLGRQSAYERVSHLLVELSHRLDEIGFATGTFVPMPLTQEMIADALGLSIVHVNRTLKQLRRERLIELRAGSLRVIKPAALAAIADFREPAIPRLLA